MSLIWTHCEQNRCWQPFPLNGEIVGITGDPREPVVRGKAGAVIIVPGPLGGAAWALLCSPGVEVFVNGDPVVLGIRMLMDRDSIRLRGGECVFFSTESLARIVPYSGARAIPCARCKTDIAPGTLAVRCQCGAWHHQEGALACFTYDQKCANCDRPTAMNGGYLWSPEGL
jgi:hypothetical protein